MPRSKLNKKRVHHEKMDVEMAVQEVLQGKLSIRAAGKQYGFAKSALARHIKTFKDSNSETFSYSSNYDVNKVFSEEEETSLILYVQTAARMHYGLTLKQLKQLAYEYAKANGKKYPEKWDKERAAGDGWAKGFRKRHDKDISMRKPEGTSLARATSFNKETVGKFFKAYEHALSQGSFTASQIYNVDETGITTVQQPPKILAPKGVKQIGSKTSSERGVLVTMINAISAGGNTVPPLFVFPRVNYKDYMLKGAPVDSIGAANPSGWSNEVIFLQYMKHFIAHVKPSKNDKVILLLDNHQSHISIPTIDLAKESGVILVTFHPHTSHKMQPLDLTVYGPFKTFYATALSDWMKSPHNAGKPVTIYDLPEIAGKAYLKAFNPANITKGFATAGIYPLDTNIFCEEDFLPSFVTDRPNPASLAQPGSSSGLQSTSLQTPSTSSALSPSLDMTKPAAVSPFDVMPFPKAAARNSSATGRGRKKGRARVLTDTPEKIELEEEARIRLEKHSRKTQLPKTIKRVKMANERIEKEENNEEDMDDLDPEESESETEDESMVLESEFEGESFSEEEMELGDIDKDSLKEGDYVLVQIKGKKTTNCFVAIIVGISNTREFVIKYFKKTFSIDYRCIFYMHDDKEYAVDVDDIVMKLPTPMSCGSSARQQTQLVFSVSFSGVRLG